MSRPLCENDTLLTVDGLSVVRRVYEAANKEDSPELAEQVLSSSLASLRRALFEHKPTHALAAFDYGGDTWRHRLYPDYKANRAPTPQLIRDLLPELCFELSVMGYACEQIPDVEADDVLAAVVKSWTAAGGGKVVLISTDKDLCALLAYPNVSVRNHFDRTWRDLDWLKAKFCVGPDKLTEVLALMGDVADNVPGVPGIGPKGAAALLEKHGSLEAAIAAAPSCTGAAYKKLIAHADAARLSKKLVQLKDDVALTTSWESCVLEVAV